MPRRRHKDRQQLPKYVYRGNGRYIYREYLGVEHGKPVFAPDKPLCSLDAPLSEVWAAYKALVESDANTLGWLMDKYLDCERFHKLAQSTRDMYQRNARQIRNTPIKGGRVFGDVSIKTLTPGVFRKYMDKRSVGAPVQANRELSFLQSVFAYAFERDIVSPNPVKGVRKNAETARKRYITDKEYRLVYDLAPPKIKAAMELAYLCRMRLVEVRELKRSHMKDEGLLIERRKGSRWQVIEWTPRLRQAVQMGISASGKVTRLDPYVIERQGGGQITDSGFKTVWQRLMRKAVEKGLSERFTFHDLKAKGISDFEGDKSRAAGHKSARVAADYDRRLETIKATK